MTATISTRSLERQWLQDLEDESIHIIREVAGQFERPVVLFSGGKDSIVMLHLAVKAFWPGKVPFAVMHVDTGHNFPEVIEYRDRHLGSLGITPVIASVQESIDSGRIREIAGSVAQSAADHDAARRDYLEQVRRRPRWRAPRRGEGPRQGAHLQRPRRLRPVGPAQPAPRALGPLQRPAPPGRARAGLPDLELDRARHLVLHRERGHRGAQHLLHARAAGLPAGRDGAGGDAVDPADRGRERSAPSGCATAPLATPPAPGRFARWPSMPSRLSSRPPPRRSPSAARPARTTEPAKPRWKTGSGKVIFNADCS